MGAHGPRGQSRSSRQSSRDRDSPPAGTRGRAAGELEAPAAALPGRAPVLPLLGAVTFPDMLVPLNVGQPRSVALIQDVLGGDRMLALVANRNQETETPGPDELYGVGVIGVVGAHAARSRRLASGARPDGPADPDQGLPCRPSPTWSRRSWRSPM